MKENKLKCYFVEAKGHDEPNGVAVIAYLACERYDEGHKDGFKLGVK